jgi:hypothetical protein
MKNLLLFLSISLANLVSAQAPSIQWQKSYGGSGLEAAASIQQTSDGGYIVAGYSNSNDGDVSGNHGGQFDYWIVKLDVNGIIQWQKSLGGSAPLGGFGSEYATSIQQTSDGGYIVVGQSDSNDGDVSGNHGLYDCWVVKLDPNGILQWQKSYGGSGWDRANSIQETTDGGYIVAGWSSSNDGDVSGNIYFSDNYWIVKLDVNGIIQWQRTFGGDSGGGGTTSIQQTSDGGYIVAGFYTDNGGDVTGNHGQFDYWIVKIDAFGILQWQKSLGGSVEDYANSIQQTSDGGYIVAGQSNSNDGDVTGNHGEPDYWIVKLDPNGIIQWQKSLGGSSWDQASAIQQTTDGGYLVTGSSSSNDGDVTGNHGDGDLWVVKLDLNGNIEWQKSYGGSGGEGAHSIQETSDGGYIVAGYSNSNDGDVSGNHGDGDLWVVKLNSTSSISNLAPSSKTLLNVHDLMGRISEVKPHQLMLYVYNDGTVEKKVIIE